ncbi:hypothetical protein VQL36_02720 [Chengkuizengella sp. SCS-71B]|uniref:hypothetical protein n=1 Tax=Chengkuizengella sp. SCS-71B TaxID=3115290 RepID=UPI0032C23BC9
MGLKQKPFVVCDSVSVLDPYGGEGSIILVQSGMSVITPLTIVSIDVCVRQSQKTKVSLDFLSQAAIEDMGLATSFGLVFQLQRNGIVVATINDEMDYVPAGSTGRYTNFSNFPLVDDEPDTGINKYELILNGLSFTGTENIGMYIGSRSLKATVFIV